MAKSVLAGLFFTPRYDQHMGYGRMCDCPDINEKSAGVRKSTLAFALLWEATAGEDHQRAMESETVLRTGSSWDGEPYKSYPSGQPELSILKITLAPYTELDWHSHPIPNAAYIISGELTLQRKKDGKKQAFFRWTGGF